MLSEYNHILGHKILYKNPLFIVELKLRDINEKTDKKTNEKTDKKTNKKLGGKQTEDNTLYETIIHDEELRVRFMFAIHKTFEHPCLLLRDIFRNESFNLDSEDYKIKHSADATNLVNKFLYLDDISLDKELESMRKTKDKLEIQEIDYNEESKYFLDFWQEFLSKLNIKIYYRSIDRLLELLKKKNVNVLVDNHRNDSEHNPLYHKNLVIEVL